MKTHVYDRLRGGLIVLVMLTIAVIASQAGPKFDESAPTADALSSVVDSALDHSIRIEISIDGGDSVPDSPGSDELSLQ